MSLPAAARRALSLRRPIPLALRLVAVLFVTGLLASGTAEAASGLTSWSRPATYDYAEPVVTSSAVAQGRTWRLTMRRSGQSVLRSRQLRGGEGRTVAVRVPVPRGATQLIGETSTGDPDPDLQVAGGRGFATGTWCVEDAETEDEYACERSRSFYVEFSLRTGKVRKSTLTDVLRPLVGGTRVSIVSSGEPRDRRRVYDAITGRTVLRLPRLAGDVQGAGRFLSYKTGQYREGSTSWTSLRVLRRSTRALRYAVSRKAITRAGGPVTIQETLLSPDGSTGFYADAEPPMRPLVVDGRGRLQRVGRPLAGVNVYTTEPRGSRVFLSAATNSVRRRCSNIAGWLTNLDGTLGNELRQLPRTPGYRIAGVPFFASNSTLSWPEKKGRIRETYRERFAQDLRAIPLTRAQRPRC